MLLSIVYSDHLAILQRCNDLKHVRCQSLVTVTFFIDLQVHFYMIDIVLEPLKCMCDLFLDEDIVLAIVLQMVSMRVIGFHVQSVGKPMIRHCWLGRQLRCRLLEGNLYDVSQSVSVVDATMPLLLCGTPLDRRQCSKSCSKPMPARPCQDSTQER